MNSPIDNRLLTQGIFHAPSEAEIQTRIERVQAKMAEQQLDWYVCFDPHNVYYLTHFANYVHERPFLLLIPASGELTYIVPRLELPHVLSRKIGEIKMVDYAEFPAIPGKAWYDRLDDVIGQARRVGVESICQLQILDAIRAEHVRTDIIDDLRMVKSDYEIGRMVYAAQIANAALADLLSNARVGQSLSEVMAAGNKLMFGRLLKDNPAINPAATRIMSVIQSPQYADDPHNFSNLDMHIEEGGPHMSIINAQLNGYGTEVERNFFMGHVPEAAKRPYDVMMQARRLIFDMVKPGIRMSDIDRASNDLIRANGYGDNLIHRAGHGMGVTAHEAPFLAEGDTRIIEAGMSFTVEPGIYIAGLGGFRHSDTILVTDDGNVQLTEGPDTLEALTL
jgi:Xaa-Pro dipeptidase